MTFRKLVLILCLCVLMPVQVLAQGLPPGTSIIRDTEIEEYLKTWTKPIFTAAGLNPDSVHIVLVQSDDINAFVAGGSNIFLYSGLIAAAKNPGELLGVIAHETGHIAGGHLIRGREQAEHATYEAMLASLLGIGISAAGGGDAGTAIMRGGQGAALSGYLANSRATESSADQAGLRFLQEAGYSPKGMMTFLETLQDQELLPQSEQNAYVRTHPLTRDRIETMEQAVDKSPLANKPYPAEWQDQFDRMRGKLIAFISPDRVNWLYGANDNSIPALYAKSIAAYRNSDKGKALDLIDRVIAAEPNNPYAYELRGQMQRDFGNMPEAITNYRKAIALKPDAALIRVDLAQVLIEQGSRANFAEAEKNLDMASTKETHSGSIHRLYATMYGREGREPEAQYHLAEESALQGHTDEASRLLTQAMQGLKPGSKSYRQATDLKAYLDSKPKKDDKKDDE